MATIKIEHLRAQVQVLIKHYAETDSFVERLLVILNRYRQKKSTINSWLSMKTSLPAFHVPEIIISELTTRLENIAREDGDSTIKIADQLWMEDKFECKLLAAWMMFQIPDNYYEIILGSLEKWINDYPEDYLISRMIKEFMQRDDLLSLDQFHGLVEGWLQSPNIKIKKIGIQAMEGIAKLKSFGNLPKLFRMIEIQITDYQIETKNDLLRLIGTLVERSEAETASFLISMAKIHRNEKVSAFIRRCFEFFGDFYRKELEKGLIL